MTGELKEFFWYVPEKQGAFEWVKQGSRSCDVLLQKAGASFTYRNVLKGSVALYRVVGGIDPSPEGILAFTHRYGVLGSDLPDAYLSERGDVRFPASTYDAWCSHICFIRQFVRIWDLAAGNDQQQLAKSFKRGGDGSYHFLVPDHVERHVSASDFKNLAQQAFNVPGLERFPNGQLVGVALFWTLQWLSYMMEETVFRIPRYDPRCRLMYLADTPANLLGATCLQLALAIQNATPSRRCEACGRWFELSPGRSRADRLTCSQTCRNRLHLRRQEEARELYAVGTKPKQIAKELGTDENTIKKWLLGKKG